MEYEIHDWHGGINKMLTEHPAEWSQILAVIENFQLTAAHFAPDPSKMNKSLLAEELQAAFKGAGWTTEVQLGTHQVDCVRNKVAVEIEWHSTDKSFPRDVLNFEQLRKKGLIDVGVIVTRAKNLRKRFRESGKRDHASTSHIDKLVGMMKGTSEDDCPVVGIALTS